MKTYKHLIITTFLFFLQSEPCVATTFINTTPTITNKQQLAYHIAGQRTEIMIEVVRYVALVSQGRISPVDAALAIESQSVKLNALNRLARESQISHTTIGDAALENSSSLVATGQLAGVINGVENVNYFHCAQFKLAFKHFLTALGDL